MIGCRLVPFFFNKILFYDLSNDYAFSKEEDKDRVELVYKWTNQTGCLKNYVQMVEKNKYAEVI